MSSNTDGQRLGLVLLAALGLLVLFPVLFMGFGMMGAGGMMGGAWGGHLGAGGAATGWVPIVGLVMQLLFLLAVVGGAYFLFRAVAGDGGHDPAIEELRSAYARGDLSEEEYERRREALERDGEG
jgi:putative membrane protein